MKLDYADPAGRAAGQRYAIDSYPTFLVLDGAEQVIGVKIGYKDEADFAAWLRAVLADPLTLREREARLAAAPRVADAIALGDIDGGIGRFVEAIGFYDRALEIDAAAAKASGVPLKRLMAHYRGVGVGAIGFDDAGRETAAFLRAEELAFADALAVGESLLRAAGQFGVEPLAPLLRLARARVEALATPERSQAKAGFLAEYSLRVEGDGRRAADCKRASLPSGWERDPHALNSFAWWCFQARINLAEAESLAAVAVALAGDSDLQANSLDTQAQLAFLRGDRVLAVELSRRAAALAPENGYLKEQLDRFQQ